MNISSRQNFIFNRYLLLGCPLISLKFFFFFVLCYLFSKRNHMTNKLFLVCLLLGLVCAYCEYYWMRHGYRSLAIVASKCPKPSLHSTALNNQTIDSTDSILTWFWKIFLSTKDKQLGPTVCETFEIHTDPRSIFLLIKTCCLIALTWKLISSLKTLPTFIRTRHAARKDSTGISSMPKGDGLVQQTKLFETSNGKLGLVTTTIDKRNLSIREK